MSVLVIPIDSSQVPENERKQQRVKIAIKEPGGIKSQVISVEPGQTQVKLDVDPKQALSIAVGPESASDEDLFHLQTLTARVSPNSWGDQKTLTIAPIALTPAWWRLWLRWCREFVIEGHVRCADGSPVPGAEVHAYDVDFFWWWSSVTQVGPTAITGPDGHFSITFRWCCGWWPWWWWELRHWRLEPLLVEKIQPVLKLNPTLRVPEPSPVPSLDFVALNPQPLPPGAATASRALTFPRTRKLDPSTIPAAREKLITVLPHVPDLERLRIWPWWPWTPWFDCAPDIIFRVTQNCGGGQVKVIVNENIFQARWDIPTHIDVTLVANQEACCIPHPDPDPLGDCAVLTGVCGDPGYIAANIGGNSAHPGGPDGYENPGGRDRPFSEGVTISGLIGVSPQSDYYEIEFSPHLANAWNPVPPAALLDFTRGYFDATQVFPNNWFYPGFPVKTFGTKHVYESRHHYESTHPPNNWGNVVTGRAWFLNVNLLAYIETAGNFADGAYDFRVKGYKSLANGDLDLTDPGVVLPGCGGHAENNLLVLSLDNRIVGPQQPGTVHVNTTEPDCGITAVSLGGSTILPCGARHLDPGTPLDIDFFVTDEPIGHLDHYELKLLWGLGNVRDLLAGANVDPGITLTTSTPGAQVGPDYAQAVAQGATRPTWTGGTMRLHFNDASATGSNVFPVTCCYLVELTVWKRNIVSCNGNLTYYNQMHYSFTVNV